jgi:diguanylate cyclase (GGDEF)-like protein
MTEESLGRDPLLALHNRRYLLYEIERHVKRYRRHRHPFSLLMVDIHNLEWIDANCGPAVGNSVLGHLADLITENTRELDVWYLCTRDQFVIIMEETDTQGARTVAERLAAEAEETKSLFSPDGVTLEMSFSTASCPDDGVEAETLLQAAGFLRAGTLQT